MVDSPDPTTEAKDHRRASRQRTLKGGRVVYGNFSLSCECLIRNMSDTGARLRIDRSIGIPSEFYLLIPAELRIAKAKMMWQKGDEIGIEFLEPMRNPKLDPDPRIARLVM